MVYCVHSKKSIRRRLRSYKYKKIKPYSPKALCSKGLYGHVRFCTVFSERSALIEKIAGNCYLQEEDERYAEDEFQMLCLMVEKLHGDKCACAAAERCQNQQQYFRHTPAMQFSEGFIRTVDDKGGAVDEDQVII